MNVACCLSETDVDWICRASDICQLKSCHCSPSKKGGGVGGGCRESWVEPVWQNCQCVDCSYHISSYAWWEWGACFYSCRILSQVNVQTAFLVLIAPMYCSAFGQWTSHLIHILCIQKKIENKNETGIFTPDIQIVLKCTFILSWVKKWNWKNVRISSQKGLGCFIYLTFKLA